MQEVKTPHPSMIPPAARLEDRTQPMGPLEEGDQALVDAAHRLPEGEHTTTEGAPHAKLFKQDNSGGIVAVTETAGPDGTVEQSRAIINKAGMSSRPAITAGTAEWPKGEYFGKSSSEVTGNDITDIGEGGALSTSHTDRQEAQAIKLEVADKIDAAREHLGHKAVENARHAT